MSERVRLPLSQAQQLADEVVDLLADFCGAEEWRAVPGYEGRYEVSDHGRVRSLRDNRGRDRAGPLVLRGTPGSAGYPKVNLGGSTRSVHRLVLEAFVGPCPDGCEASHLNGQAGDPRLGNLRWEPKPENNRRKAEHGTMPAGERHPLRLKPDRAARGDRHGSRLHPERVARGERQGAYTHPERLPRGETHGNAKLTDPQVVEIRAAAARGERSPKLAARFGVSKKSIFNIVRRRTWRHVE